MTATDWTEPRGAIVEMMGFRREQGLLRRDPDLPHSWILQSVDGQELHFPHTSVYCITALVASNQLVDRLKAALALGNVQIPDGPALADVDLDQPDGMTGPPDKEYDAGLLHPPDGMAVTWRADVGASVLDDGAGPPDREYDDPEDLQGRF
jgi:hypothetical protein